jgi:hypothetical protein
LEYRQLQFEATAASWLFLSFECQKEHLYDAPLHDYEPTVPHPSSLLNPRIHPLAFPAGAAVQNASRRLLHDTFPRTGTPCPDHEEMDIHQTDLLARMRQALIHDTTTDKQAIFHLSAVRQLPQRQGIEATARYG